MNHRKVNSSLLAAELRLFTARSSGPGGQNVNKVESKVTLKFDVINSIILTNEEKQVILEKLASMISNDGVLILSSQESRSQFQNREQVFIKLDTFLLKAFQKRKVRKATKPSRSSRLKKLEKKKRISEKKAWRRKL